MISSQRASLFVRDIFGTSRFNPRPHPGGDLGGLKASIRAAGVLQPLTVVVAATDGYETLDGSRRWHALGALIAAGDIAADFSVPVNIVTGTEAELREIALAANVHRLDLHPVERYEAFAALVGAGMSVEAIARDFHLETRDVRRALALGALHEFVRNAWRCENINADQAAAFTAGDPDSQAKLLPDVLDHTLAPKEIRARLRGDAVPATDARALFARAEYLAAGGLVDDSLFEEQSFFRDAVLLDRVANDKLQAIADKIAREEGWGVAAIDTDGFADHGDVQPDYGDEAARAEELSETFEAHGFETARDVEQAEIELAAIERRAYARAVPEALRGQFGVYVELDANGDVLVTRGLALVRNMPRNSDPDASAASGGAPGVDPQGESGSKGAAGALHAAPKLDTTKPDGSKALRAVLDTAIETAFRRAIAGRPDIAIMLALAQLSTGGGNLYGLKLIGGMVGSDHKNDLLKQIDDKTFSEALAIAADAGNPDCIPAFAQSVGFCISPRDLPLANLEPIAKALVSRGVALGPHLDATIDRIAYFKAATKDAALDVIRELLGETAAVDAASRGKAAIADEAARIASDRRWLPPPLSTWAALPPVLEAQGSGTERAQDPERTAGDSLAAAMDEALGKDGEGRMVERFLDARTRRADGQMVHASKLHEAFVSWSIDEGHADVMALRPFGMVMTRLGHERHRKADGSHYRGLVLVPASAERSAETGRGGPALQAAAQ